MTSRSSLIAILCLLLAACGEQARAVTPTAQPPQASPQPPTPEPPSPQPPTPEPPSPQPPTPSPQPPAPQFSYPIGSPGAPPADGFFIRHGYATENTWYNPGYWHTGEDWYAGQGDTAGAEIYAVGAGEVVYVGANYPGRVVIIRHAGELYSMYGHLDPAVEVREGQQVARGALLGAVLRRGDDVPSHLHFELRSFLTTPDVNGARPRYGFRCGASCPPGPGYWPIDAPDHPGAQGWLNPTHTTAARMYPPVVAAPLGQVIVPSWPEATQLTVWAAPPDGSARRRLVDLAVQPGQAFALLELRAGPPDSRGASAEAYNLWYRIALPEGGEGWVQAAVASPFEQGGDGRPSSIMFQLIPAPDRE